MEENPARGGNNNPLTVSVWKQQKPHIISLLCCDCIPSAPREVLLREGCLGNGSAFFASQVKKFVLCGGVQGVEAPQAGLFLGKPTDTLGWYQLGVY